MPAGRKTKQNLPKRLQNPVKHFFQKKHPKIEQILDISENNCAYAALPKGHSFSVGITIL